MSRIPVVVDYTEELLTASTRQQVLSRTDARSRFGAPNPVFEISHTSELSGPYASDGRVQVAGVEHFERCGTRWHYDLAEGPVPEGTRQTMPLPPEGGERRPPGTRTRVQTLLQGTGDTGRPARFCSAPDRLLLSGPTVPAGHPTSKPVRR